MLNYTVSDLENPLNSSVWEQKKNLFTLCQKNEHFKKKRVKEKLHNSAQTTFISVYDRNTARQIISFYYTHGIFRRRSIIKLGIRWCGSYTWPQTLIPSPFQLNHLTSRKRNPRINKEMHTIPQTRIIDKS